MLSNDRGSHPGSIHVHLGIRRPYLWSAEIKNDFGCIFQYKYSYINSLRCLWMMLQNIFSSSLPDLRSPKIEALTTPNPRTGKLHVFFVISCNPIFTLTVLTFIIDLDHLHITSC